MEGDELRKLLVDLIIVSNQYLRDLKKSWPSLSVKERIESLELLIIYQNELDEAAANLSYQIGISIRVTRFKEIYKSELFKPILF